MITPEQLAASGTEHGAQSAVFCWAAINQAKYPQLKWMHSSGNGIFTTSGHKAKEKAAGLKNGVWDIFLPVPKLIGADYWSGMYIEMKVGKNNLTEDQKEFAKTMRDYYKLHVCRSWESARDEIIKYLEK